MFHNLISLITWLFCKAIGLVAEYLAEQGIESLIRWIKDKLPPR